MDSIFGIVYASNGYSICLNSWFFSSKDDAIARFVEMRDLSVDEYSDPTVIELFELNPATLEKKIIDSFEGPIDEDDWEG